MKERPLVRAMECHSGLSALIAEKASATRADGTVATFDALWSSSLTSSTIKAKPDIEVVDTTQRLQIVEDCLEVDFMRNGRVAYNSLIRSMRAAIRCVENREPFSIHGH